MLEVLQFLTTANNITISPVMAVVGYFAWKFGRDIASLKETVSTLKDHIAECCYRPPAEPIPLHRRRHQHGND